MSTLRETNRFLNKSELQKLDKISKYTVFGYIRKQKSDDLSSNTIPKLIIVIILAFYVDDTDKFDENHCGQYIKLTNNNTAVSMMTNGANTCYGKKIISSLSNGKYIWKIKLFKGDDRINIGIDNSNATHCNGNIFFKRGKAYYGLDVKYGYPFSWNHEHNKKDFIPYNRDLSDTIIMKLYLKNYLCFLMNFVNQY